MSDTPATELQERTKTAPPPQPEAPASVPVNQPGTVVKEDARSALEAIAHPELDRILTNASQLYLDQGDNRLLLTALARQTAGTPLGDELRRDVVEMIKKTDIPRFDDLKKEIADMNLPNPDSTPIKSGSIGAKTDPKQSQLVSFMERYNTTHPGQEVPGELSAPLVARALQENSALSERLWTELIGKDKPRPQLTTPDGLLGAAGLEKNDANRARTEAMFKPLKMKKDWNVNLGDMVPSVLGGMMLLSFVTQLAMTDSGQAQGH